MKKKYIYPLIEVSDSIDDFLLSGSVGAGQTDMSNQKRAGEDDASKTFNFVGFEPDDDKK